MVEQKKRRAWRPLLMIVALSFVALAGALARPARAAAQDFPVTPSPRAEATPAIPSAVEVSPVNRDEQIADRLQGILEATEWFEAPGVTVENGVVFLFGRTQQESYRAWAGELASKTRDVVAVVNRISIAERSSWDVTPAFDEVQQLIRRSIRALPLIALAVAVVLLSWLARSLVVRLARPVLARRIRSPLLLDVASRLVAVPMVLLGIYLALQFLGLTRLALTVLGGTGIAGLIVGIAFRDTVENFLASILLSTDPPFKTGDTVQIGQRTGVVQGLTTRATLLLGFDGNHIQIPNATVFKSEIVNLTVNPNQRFTFHVSLGRDSSISQAQDALMTALASHPAVLAEPEPLVLAERFSGSSVELAVSFWIDGSQHNGFKVKSAVMRLSKRALRAAGIEIANPAQQLLLPAAVHPQRVRRRATGRAAGESKDGREATTGAEALELVTQAEGRLETDEKQIQKQAEMSRETAGGTNLLAE